MQDHLWWGLFHLYCYGLGHMMGFMMGTDYSITWDWQLAHSSDVKSYKYNLELTLKICNEQNHVLLVRNRASLPYYTGHGSVAMFLGPLFQGFIGPNIHWSSWKTLALKLSRELNISDQWIMKFYIKAVIKLRPR